MNQIKQNKPGITHKGADGFSIMPLDIGKYIEYCTAAVSPEEFQSVFYLGQAPEDLQITLI